MYGDFCKEKTAIIWYIILNNVVKGRFMSKKNKYIAHITEDKKKEQSIKEHLEGTAQLAEKFAQPFGCGEWGYCCGMLHDIGKYSNMFQEYIRGKQMKVDHSTAGAQLCASLRGMYSLLAYCIAGHHAGLPDTGVNSDNGNCRTLMGRLKKNIEDYAEFKTEIQIPELKTLPFRSRYIGGEDSAFVFQLLIRMLYSCLVDADYLDTENFMSQDIVLRDPGESMEVLLEKLKKYIQPWIDNVKENTVNGRRTAILKNCIQEGEKERGLFRLTVPTGGGKTVASLAFALTHAKKYNMDRVIYVIPYTSIIEQNAKVFREILGSDNVLENHCNVEYEDTEELEQMQLAAENWDKPVVVTTNVQFFESLYANKTSKSRKLHNISNSVIIFDEAQMLPLEYLKPCVAVIEELLRHYECSIVLCTATQPALQSFFSKERSVVELCPHMEQQFTFFRRTQMQDLNVVTEQELIEKIKGEYQTLCILNTKKKAYCLYEALKSEGVYHLSTYMYPAHRRRVLAEIKRKIENNEKCIVISTSLVEAGVDLDFQTVYREVAGLDSIIQAAGRCNREGKRSVDKSLVYIFQLEEKNTSMQSRQIEVTKYILENEEDIMSQKAIRKYFEILYYYEGDFLDKKKILERFRGNTFPFATVAKEFKLIEQNTKTIFIAKEDDAKSLLKEMTQKGITRELLRKAGKYIVNVFDDTYQKMAAMGMLLPIVDGMKEDFSLLRDEEQYTWECGLQLKEMGDSGNALFFG